MPEGNLVGSQGSAQKGTYGKPKKPKVKVKVTKPKSPPKGPTFAVVESTPAELKAASKAKVAPKQKKPKNPYGQWGNKATWDLFHKPQESLYDEHGRFRHVYTPKKTDTLSYTPSALRARQAHPEDYLTTDQQRHLANQRKIWAHKYAEMMGKASDRDWADIQATRQGMGIDLGGFSGWLNRTHNQTLDLGRGIITAADILGHDVGHDVKNIATGNRNHEHSHTWRDLKQMGIGAGSAMVHNLQHPEDFTQNPYTALNWLPVGGGALRAFSAAKVFRGLKPLGMEAGIEMLAKTPREAAGELLRDSTHSGAHTLTHAGQAIAPHKVRSIRVRRPPVVRRFDPAQPARPGHVYHGTTEEGAAAIEKTGRFEPRDVRGENQGQKMVWFTRDPAYAAQHGPVVLEIPESALPADLVRVGGEGKIGPESMATTQPVVIAQKGVTLPGATKTGQFPEEGHPGFSVLKKGKAQASLFRDEEGAVKGYALYENGNIDIWVDPIYQGQGVATRLAQRLEASGADVTGALQRAVQNSTATEAGKGFATAWENSRTPTPQVAPLEGLPTKGSPSPEAHSLADQYSQASGIPNNRPTTYQKVDEGRAQQIAQAYEDMPDALAPGADPAYVAQVLKAYDSFARETKAQYDVITNAGYKFEFMPKGKDPYGSPWAAVRDLKNNKHEYIYPTDEGFGAEVGVEAGATSNPLLRDTGIRWLQDGVEKPVTENDLFRAVHDFFGHYKEGVGFRADGEENAWRSHSAMYSDEARGAMTTETRGQNSWVNYGPHGAKNRTAGQAETVYAPQKLGLMPEWTWRDGAVDAPLLTRGSRAWTAWKESALPGYARAHGWEGGIATKTRSGRAASRSALGRGIQAGTDSLARNWTDFIRATRHKQSRFDQELRSGRVFEKTKSKEDQRITAFFHRQEAYIDRALQNKPEREEAFIAALEAPRGLSYRQAVETKIKQLTQDGGERPANIEAQIEALHQALEGDFLESKVFDRAVSSGERLSEYVDRQAAEVLGMTPEELASRRNIVAQDYADRGLLPEGIDTEARGYFPHRSVFETPKAPGGAPARPPGDIGVPQLGKSFERRQNQLKRYFGGTVLRDPAVLSKTARARNMVMYKISIRRYLYDHGKPIQEWDPVPPGDSIIIRNPDAKAEKIKPEMKMAYQDPIRAMENDDPYIMTLDEFKAKSAAGTLEPEWAKDVDNLRMISPQLKNAVMADARNGTSSPALAMSLMNALVRTVILHTPYGGVRYVTRNTAQNMLLMSLTHPAAFLELRKEVRYLVKHDKEMSDAMQVEGGTIQAGMALPDKTGKVANASSRNAQLRNMQDAVIKGKDVYVKGRKVNLGLREYGRHLGWVADEPYRMAAWIRYAKDYGFKTREQRRKLMFSDDPKLKDVRDNISQYVREDLIDFDTLSPYERNTLSQILFIYPFVKGAAKWPLMYARDYPVRTGIMALLGSQTQRENLLPPGMPHSEQEASTVHGTKYGWLVPWDPMIQDVQAAEALINNVSSGNLDISPAMDFGAPWLRQIGVAGYGGGTKWDALFKTFAPGYATVKSVQKGGGWKAQFERMMGMKVEPSPFRIKEKKKDWEKVKTDWGDASDNYDLDLVTQGFKNKEDWKDLQQRAKYAGLDTGKRPTAKDNARLLNWYASQVDPEGDWHDDATLEQTNDEEFIKDYYNWMQDQLWGELDRMRRSASSNRANG